MKDPSGVILLVEDNPDDVFAFRRALMKAGIANPLRVLGDGRQAIDYFVGEGAFADRDQHPLPLLVFLDLKLPYRDGFEILRWIRARSTVADIPVIVLTGSDQTRDHQRAYSLGARSYLVKPPDPSEILQLMESLQSYWGRPAQSGLMSRG